MGVRILIVTFFFYLLAGESVPMVGFSPWANLESVSRGSWGLSVMRVLVDIALLSDSS